MQVLYYLKVISLYSRLGSFEYTYLFSAFSLAISYPLLYWALRGLDVTIVIFFFSLATYHLLAFLYSSNNKSDSKVDFFRIFFITTSVGFAILMRIDSVVMGSVIYFFLVKRLLKQSKYPLIILSLLIPFFLNLPYLVFRYYYFNEFLPNTFFLKLGGGQLLTRLSNSLYVLHENIAFYFFPMFLLLFLKKRDLKQFLANPLNF